MSMKKMQSAKIGLAAGVTIAAVLGGCAGSPVAPFDSVQSAPMTAYRLQNFEPPPQAVAAPAAAPGLLPGIPPEIQAWIKAGASMLPPGLLPPGMNPNAPAQTPAATVDNTPRFHGFRVLGMPAPVMDEKLKQELVDIFGYEKNFDNTHGNCVYAEFGFSFARIQQPPADVLVSLSCDQVQAQNFIWPHKSTGLTPDSMQRITKVAQALFGGG
jgi:hypothetical protein